jgi:type IV pilus assembly protein PilY1
MFYGASNPLPPGHGFPLTRSDLSEDKDLVKGIGSDPTSPMGWYIDLGVDPTSHIAERVNVSPTANGGVVGFAANLPNGDVCNPAGTNQTFAIAFAGGKTVLQSNDGGLHLVPSSKAVPGVVTDVAFMRANGKLRLVAGGSKGDPVQLPAQLSGSQGIKMLTWRAVPAVN